MTARLVSAVLFAVGLLHLVPALGVFSAERLAQLYGAPPQGEAIVLLLRHRAVLFALLGAFCCAAAFVPAWRTPALAAALVSTASFIALGWNQSLGPSLRVVWWADVVAATLLLIALAMLQIRPSSTA
ncbi:MAG TPA: phosphopantetheine adenylyltransferase [Burkholderiaceae bacterium]|nr:phosphopantetheine adenylyltransferase [Burkholderiaceae bacterium]